MKKLICGLLIIFFMAERPLVVYAWPAVAKVVAFVVVDAVAKYTKKKFDDKNGSHYEDVPAPGYGTGDKYWVDQDIVNHFKDYEKDYSFNNSNPPSEALAFLSNDPGQYSKIAVATIRAKSSPATVFPIDSLKSSLQKGDIYFSRSDAMGASIGQYITSWFHTGVFVDPKDGSTFESQIIKGVFRSNIRNLGRAYSWSVKRLKSQYLDSSQIAQAVDDGIFFYNGKPYSPKFISSATLREGYVSRWADKNNTESYYCSKLVWKIFKKYGVDLDSERTTCHVENNFLISKSGTGTVSNDYAWIGVSADDIYFSPYVASDIYLYGQDNLVQPIGVPPFLN